MNNKRWTYRLAKGDSFYNTGPYGYLINKIYEKEGKTKEQIQPFKDLLLSKERWSGHKYEGKISEVLGKYPIFEKYGCFSSYKTKRPGPWDDPLLKYNLLNRFGDRLNVNMNKCGWHGFAFDSLQQLHKWFDDERELKMLMSLGFRIHSEKVNQKDIVHGLKQIWILKDKI